MNFWESIVYAALLFRVINLYHNVLYNEVHEETFYKLCCSLFLFFLLQSHDYKAILTVMLSFRFTKYVYFNGTSSERRYLVQ